MIDPGLIDMIMRLRGRGISDNAVLRAIEYCPRKHFVPPDLYSQAYIERSLPLPCGQSLNPPLVVAMMSQILAIEPDSKILMVGLGSGYHAAIIGQLAKRVYVIERYKALIEQAERSFQKHDIANIVLRHGDGRKGWAGQAPFDRIILTCGVRALPDRLLDQLGVNGRLVAVVDGVLMQYDKARSKITESVIMPLELDMIEAGKSRAL